MPIYLDNAATTPLLPEVLRVMEDCLEHVFGNPSSIHRLGQEARAAIENARAKIAALLGALPNEIFFTSSGSEANNLALKGFLLRRLDAKAHVVTTAIEHSSVLEPLRYLMERFNNLDVTFINPDASGVIDPDQVADSLRPETLLISVMHANNETGMLQPVGDIAALARERGICFHCDAVQSFGKMPVDVRSLDCDLLSLSSHKIYGPKGAGLLFARRGLAMDALIHGGGQEGWRRAGTENTPAICGFAEACRIAVENQNTSGQNLRGLEKIFLQKLADSGVAFQINGDRDQSVPGVLSICFPEVRNEDLLTLCDLEGLCISAGSACHAGAQSTSHVLLAMGLPSEMASSSVRVSFGRTNTEEEAKAAGEIITQAATRLCCR